MELLVKMGYGGSWADGDKAIGRSRDGDIDGIIREDKLGLDVVYIIILFSEMIYWAFDNWVHYCQ